jgi:hypothetical protein
MSDEHLAMLCALVEVEGQDAEDAQVFSEQNKDIACRYPIRCPTKQFGVG